MYETLIEFLEKYPDLPAGTVIRVEAGDYEYRFILQSRAPRDLPEPPVFNR
jgi:hypothetical protein